jgi:hypothetical protein
MKNRQSTCQYTITVQFTDLEKLYHIENTAMAVTASRRRLLPGQYDLQNNLTFTLKPGTEQLLSNGVLDRIQA